MSETESRRQYTAFVVDDNWFNRDIFRIALESAGYEVSEAENGKQCVSQLESHTYDLLVLDLQMPEMDGRSVLRRLRPMPQHKGMRVIVVTANAHLVPGEIEDVADYVMYKPLDVSEFTNFAKRITRLIDRKTEAR